MLTKSGEIRHCITSLTLYAEQGILEGSILDATERRRAEEALRESEGRLRAITRDMPDTILQTDRQGRIVFVNRVAGGISMDRALSSTVFDYVLPEEAPIVAEALAAVFDDGRTCQYESKGPGPDGGWHDFEVRVSPIFVGGQPDSAIFLARDVTARNRAAQERAGLEEQLRQSQKMEAIGTLAGGIAHDFNNLLTPILAHTDLALMQLPDSSPVREDLTQVFTAAQRATEIVRQILTISRSEGPLEAGPVNLAALVKEAMKFLRASIPATIEMSVTTADSTPLVRGTTARLHQVLLNLCANARDAIGDGPGTITVTVGPWQPLENGPWEGMESSGEDWVLLSVRDTGPGIAPELLDRVIEPYFTTKPAEKGTGLGLSVCHGIVAGFGGHLRVRSPPGEGATVAVLLPVLAPQPTEAPPAPESPRGRGEHVLVVDDEAMVARVLARMLVSLGYRVTTLTTAREALELFRSDPSSVDLVVTDYTMPVMTGFALAHALREVRPDVPVLVGTGHAEGVDEEAVTRLRLQGLMRKPYTLAALAAAVTRALSGRPGPP
jgi:PAS domain S-box-containing protein